MAEKTVIQHLENIEEGIQRLGKDNKPFDFKKEIGIEFEELVEKSTIYFEATDKIAFKVEKMSSIKNNVIYFLLGLIPIVVYFILHSIFDIFEFSALGTVTAVFPLLVNLLGIVHISLAKPTRRAKSLWRMKNKQFYVVDGTLKSYETASFFGIVVIILRIIGCCLIIAYFLVTFLNIDVALANYNFYLMLGIEVLNSLNLFNTHFSFYTYNNNLLFDMGNYVVKDIRGIFERVDK